MEEVPEPPCCRNNIELERPRRAGAPSSSCLMFPVYNQIHDDSRPSSLTVTDERSEHGAIIQATVGR